MIRDLCENDDGGQMFNMGLMKFNKIADYKPESKFYGKNITGSEAFDKYMGCI